MIRQKRSLSARATGGRKPPGGDIARDAAPARLFPRGAKKFIVAATQCRMYQVAQCFLIKGARACCGANTTDWGDTIGVAGLT